jgi:hypothetical protein
MPKLPFSLKCIFASLESTGLFETEISTNLFVIEKLPDQPLAYDKCFSNQE